MRQLILVLHNIRSTHNVGSLLRTAEGLGIEEVLFSGYTPYPRQENDDRLLHLSQKIDNQIAKTALGAEKLIKNTHQPSIRVIVADLKSRGYLVAALEQAEGSTSLVEYLPPNKLALIVGREVEGLEPEVLAATDLILEIPMFGNKESYNVSVAAGMALFSLRFAN